MVENMKSMKKLCCLDEVFIFEITKPRYIHGIFERKIKILRCVFSKSIFRLFCINHIGSWGKEMSKYVNEILMHSDEGILAPEIFRNEGLESKLDVTQTLIDTSCKILIQRKANQKLAISYIQIFNTTVNFKEESRNYIKLRRNAQVCLTIFLSAKERSYWRLGFEPRNPSKDKFSFRFVLQFPVYFPLSSRFGSANPI